MRYSVGERVMYRPSYGRLMAKKGTIVGIDGKSELTGVIIYRLENSEGLIAFATERSMGRTRDEVRLGALREREQFQMRALEELRGEIKALEEKLEKAKRA